MHGFEQFTAYREALVFLVTAGIVAPLFLRLRISPVLGYISAGALLGPYGLGRLAGEAPWLKGVLLSDVDEIRVLGEIGVVMLMFTIGLELSFARLKSLRRLVFGLGPAQLLVSTALIAGAALLIGQTPAAAIVFGAALSLSSTAMVVPTLAEAKLQRGPIGRFAFSVLLFQDLAVAPLLFMVSMLSGSGSEGFAWRVTLMVAPAAAAVGAVILIGRLGLRPLFRSVAMTRSPEFFMAACLLVVLGAGLIAAVSGLSMALGAFLAGLLLAETEYRREIEVTIEPFKGLALGLFFVSIGAELDLSLALAQPGLVFGALAAFIGLKVLAFYPLARGFGASRFAAGGVALALGPGGEFAFVLVGVGLAGGLLDADASRIVLLAAALSMVTIPFLGKALAALATRRRAQNVPAEAKIAPPEDGERRAILVGYGRVGQLIGDMLEVHGIPYLAVDSDANVVAAARRDGKPAYFGDASRAEFLRNCGIERARAVVVTTDAFERAERVVMLARELRPDITLVARARDAEHARALYRLGVTDAVPETIEASLQLSEAVLVDIGIPMGLVIASIHEKRDQFRKMLVAAGAPERPRGARRKPLFR
ncbi:MAG TPA: cation:proton antiporter [Roseiarcus sp.]|nr:cation:proton antiporter [Roseiarcus sp.]